MAKPNHMLLWKILLAATLLAAVSAIADGLTPPSGYLPPPIVIQPEGVRQEFFRTPLSHAIDALIKQYAEQHNAMRSEGKDLSFGISIGYGPVDQRLLINGIPFNTSSATYMDQSRPGETCRYPKVNDKKDPYRCVEGQIEHDSCFLYFVNDTPQIKAVHRFDIHQPKPEYPAYCMGFEAMGLVPGQPGDLLVTLEYHDTESPLASRVEDLGNGWMQTTVLLHVYEKNGELTIVQDDTCLGNPNKFDTIAKARKALKKCAARQQGKQGR